MRAAPSSSENQPTSLTTSGLPSERPRSTEPEVSPIVGARSETSTSHAPISDQSRSSGTYSSRSTRSDPQRPSAASKS